MSVHQAVFVQAKDPSCGWRCEVWTMTGLTDQETRALAQRSLSALRALLAFVDSVGGYTTPEQQAAIREARAVVEEGEG